MGIDTLNTRIGPYTVLGPFNWDHPGVAGDYGYDLGGNSWNDVKQVPRNDTNPATYTGSSIAGGVSTDSGDYAGPYGNSDVDGTILAASFFWRVKKLILSPKFQGKYGRCVPADVGTDGTSSTAEETLTTSYQEFWVVLDASSASVPDENDLFQMGFAKVGSGVMHVSEMWPFALHQEPVVDAEQPAVFMGCNF